MPKIIVNNWHKGIAQSPWLGFADTRNVDISSVYGVFKPNFDVAKESASLIDGEVYNIIFNPADANDAWAVANGKVFRSTDGGDSWSLISGNTTTGSGWNIVIWKDYLLYFRYSSSTQIIIETYGPLSSSPSWTTAWQTISSVESGSTILPLVHAQDDIVYFAGGKYVHFLKEAASATFLPGTSSTYVLSTQVLKLPAGYIIQTLNDLSTYLVVGASRGPSFRYPEATLFPWDRTSPSFSLPTRIPDFGVRAAITIGRTLYFFVGGRGRLFAFNGVEAREITRLPHRLFGFDSNPENTVVIYPHAVAQKGDKIFFGVGAGNNTSGPYGVFSYNLITGALNHEHKISTGTQSGATVVPSALQYRGSGRLLIGWKDATTYGIDRTSTTAVYGSYSAFITSKFFYVGTFERPAEFSKLGIILGKNLASGDAVRISTREAEGDSFTTLKTFDYATYGARYYYEEPIRLTARTIQVKTEITTSGTSVPEVLEVRLY